MVLSHSIRYLLPLKIIIKEVVENLGTNSEKLKFFSSSTVYKENNGAIVVSTSTSKNPTSKQIDIKYNKFMQNTGNNFLFKRFNMRITGQIFSLKFCKANYLLVSRKFYTLTRLHMRGSVSRNIIFSLKLGYYVPKGIFWTIGEYSYFCL